MPREYQWLQADRQMASTNDEVRHKLLGRQSVMLQLPDLQLKLLGLALSLLCPYLKLPEALLK